LFFGWLLLDTVKFVALVNKFFYLPEHLFNFFIFSSYLQHLLALEIVESIRNSLSKFLCLLLLVLLPPLNEALVFVAVEDLELHRNNEKSKSLNHQGSQI